VRVWFPSQSCLLPTLSVSVIALILRGRLVMWVTKATGASSTARVTLSASQGWEDSAAKAIRVPCGKWHAAVSGATLGLLSSDNQAPLGQGARQVADRVVMTEEW
jgi:hypothetical protein